MCSLLAKLSWRAEFWAPLLRNTREKSICVVGRQASAHASFAAQLGSARPNNNNDDSLRRSSVSNRRPIDLAPAEVAHNWPAFWVRSQAGSSGGTHAAERHALATCCCRRRSASVRLSARARPGQAPAARPLASKRETIHSRTTTAITNQRRAPAKRDGNT